MNNDLTSALKRILSDTLRAGLRSLGGTTRTPPRRTTSRTTTPRTTTTRTTSTSRRPPALSQMYPGDYRGMPTVSYVPTPGRRPDPGEIVWTWVPYEEDHSQGKDRPVLLVGRDGDWLLGLQLTSVDHDLDAAQEASEGRYWVDIGRGAWDPQGRASEVRVDRVIRVHPDEVRRVSVSLPKEKFDRVVKGMRLRLR